MSNLLAARFTTRFVRPLVFACAGAASLGAQASRVTFETATSLFASPNGADAAWYRSSVEAALAQPGAHFASVPLFDGLTSYGQFGGFNNNLAYRTTVQFVVTAAQAGSWGLRVGGDFGYGAAVFLDGVALGVNNTAMDWSMGFASPTQTLQFASVAITAGLHTLILYGREDCCDGGEQGQFKRAGGDWVTFGTSDGLASPVPAPQSWALMAAGLAGLSVRLRARRRG